MIKLCYFISAILIISCLDTISAMAQLPDRSDENDFAVGSSCEQLSELSSEELHEVIVSLTEESSRTFCVPQWPNTCDDYDAFVTGFGRLEESAGRSFCRIEL